VKTFAEIAFTPAVQALQERHGSRAAYARAQARYEPGEGLGPREAEHLSGADSLYMATLSESGWPYVQHRGGPRGFLKVLSPIRLAFADFSGNRQYITTGNLAENPRAFIFLMDYASRRRVKLWGEARVVEDDPELTRRLTIEGYLGRPEQVIVFTLKAWDVNCPQHIPQMFFVEDIKEAVDGLKNRIAQLEQENAELRAAQGAKEQRGGT